MDDKLNLVLGIFVSVLGLLLVGGSFALEACDKKPSEFLTHTAAATVGAMLMAFNLRIGRTGQQRQGN